MIKKRPETPHSRRPSGTVRADDDHGAGDLVRSRRKELGITQSDLAERAMVSRQTIISLESGDYAPSVYLALRIARLLGSSVEELWGAPD
jgi:putative transcriptional regulator